MTRPFAPFEWMIAIAYLRARRQESMISLIAILSFLGIMLGVAALIIVMAVMNGFRTELLSRILGVNGHIVVSQPVGGLLDDTAKLATKILKLPEVIQASPVIRRQALIMGPAQAAGIYIRGIPPKNLANVRQISDHIVEGRLADFEQGMVIGKRLARRIGVRSGDDVTILSPRGVATPFGMVPRSRRIKVVALFEVGMSEIDQGLVFMPLRQAQAFLNAPGEISSIEVLIKNPDNTSEVVDKIGELAEQRAEIQDWRQTNATLASALKVERNVMFVILTMIIMIAALNIISGLVFLVKDKASEIAMLRAMGVTRGVVMRIFFIAGSSIGLLGTLGGFFLGWAVCANIEEIRQFVSYLVGVELFSPDIYFLSQLPADMDVWETASAVMMALALSFGATIYPALRAASIYPAEALRYE